METAQVMALPLLSTTIMGIGLVAGHKLLSGKMQLLGLVPGLVVGIFAYYQNQKSDHDDYDYDSDDDYVDDEISYQINNQW